MFLKNRILPVLLCSALSSCSGLKSLEMDSLFHQEANPSQKNATNIYLGTDLLKAIDEKDARIKDQHAKLQRNIGALHQKAEREHALCNPSEPGRRISNIHQKEEDIIDRIHRSINNEMESNNREIRKKVQALLESLEEKER